MVSSCSGLSRFINLFFQTGPHWPCDSNALSVLKLVPHLLKRLLASAGVATDIGDSLQAVLVRGAMVTAWL